MLTHEKLKLLPPYYTRISNQMLGRQVYSDAGTQQSYACKLYALTNVMYSEACILGMSEIVFSVSLQQFG